MSFVDLRDVADQAKATVRYRMRLAKLLGRYPTRRALLERVTRAGLTPS